MCYKDLDEGLLMGLEMTIEEMTEMGNPVHHATIEARDALKDREIVDRENGKHPAGGTPKKSRPKKPKKPSRLTRQQKLLIAVAVVLAIVLIAVVACQSLFVRPDLPDKNADADSETQEEEIDWGEGTRPRSDGERKSQDYYTVLILGRDTGGGGNTDTMLLASYDVTNQKATVMSIPRDTMVNVSWDIKKINSVYNWYGGGDRGIQYLYKEIAQLVGFEPDYQVIVEWEAVGQIVDAMGGVWFDVPRDMYYSDPLQNLYINQKAGYRLLTGDDAMQCSATATTTTCATAIRTAIWAASRPSRRF